MRWEYGSDFSFCEAFFEERSEDVSAQQELWIWEHAHKTACGRQAFRALEEHLFAQQSKRRLWLPSYYCQEVLAAFSACWQTALYECLPGQAFPALPINQLQPGDVVFVCNTFGYWKQPDISLPDGCLLVEDHTHAFSAQWATQSKADYCFASLRKYAPLPDGALLWSPKGHPLPKNPTTSNERSSELKLRAMKLKSQYLEQIHDEKEHFRTLFLQGEEALVEEKGVVGMSSSSQDLFCLFKWRDWREAKLHNLKLFEEGLTDWCGGTLLKGETDELFSLTIVCEDQEQRDALRKHLIQQSIYPAILWSIAPQQSTEEAHNLSTRILSLPIDGRYHEDDIQKVCQIIQQFS